MRFISTRGNESVTGAQAIAQGIADGVVAYLMENGLL